MTRLLASTAVLALSATAAFAGGTAPAPVVDVVIADPAPTSDWTGLYVGLEYGVIDGTYDGDNDRGHYPAAFIGYMHDFGDIVLGAEAMFAGPVQWPGEFEGDEDIYRLYRLRAGYDMGSFLPYVTIGGSHTNYVGDDGGGVLAGAGLGVEYAVTDALRLGLDLFYQHNDSFEGDNEYQTTQAGLRISYGF